MNIIDLILTDYTLQIVSLGSSLLGSLLLVMVVIFWKEFKIVSFDIDFAESLGFDTKKITMLLFAMIVMSIIIGLQTVGVILMSAMLTAPAVAARQWTDKLHVMAILSAVFGAISGIGGTVVSSVISKLPTGPMIVVIISIIVIISLTLAPNRGLVWRYIRSKRNQKNIGEDQILANVYHLAMNHDNENHGHDIFTISADPNLKEKGKMNIKNQLEHLKLKGLTSHDESGKWFITDKGIDYVENYFREEEI